MDYIGPGATRIEEILFRGRWASLNSTRHCIQEGPALMASALQEVPEWQRQFARFVAENPTLWFHLPSPPGLL